MSARGQVKQVTIEIHHPEGTEDGILLQQLCREVVPSAGGIYIVHDAAIPLYIGASINLKLRLGKGGHHKLRQILNSHPNARVMIPALPGDSSYSYINLIEAAHIHVLDAIYNGKSKVAMSESTTALAHVEACGRAANGIEFPLDRVLQAIDLMPTGTPSKNHRSNRWRWLAHLAVNFNAETIFGLRQGFFADKPDFATEASRYRLSLGLSAIPAPTDGLPALIPDFVGRVYSVSADGRYAFKQPFNARQIDELITGLSQQADLLVPIVEPDLVAIRRAKMISVYD
jgi:hypothetical protein